MGDYVNHNDYYSEGDFDYKAFSGFTPDPRGSITTWTTSPTRTIPKQGPRSTKSTIKIKTWADYGRRVTIDEVKVRGKLPSYPAHINLSYWRMEKQGNEQLRFRR